MKNVKEYGAWGDGEHNDTAAIQRSLDESGMARLTKGVYLSGTLFLPSGGRLLLDSGAVLLASPHAEDYNADDFCSQNRVFREEDVTGRHLIVAVEANDIAITGDGCIDGNFQAWMSESDMRGYHFRHNPERPGQMIFLCECSGVRISGVMLRNSPYWNCFLHGCTDVDISGLTIKGDPRLMNNDGIDLDCCSDVRVRDCSIDVADDAITLRANIEPLKNKRNCENISVRNCHLSSSCANAIRLGVGDGIVRNAVFSGIDIGESRTGICLVSRYSPLSVGCDISSAVFENITTVARRLVNIKLDDAENMPEPPCDKTIENIVFRNISGCAEHSAYITGNSAGVLRNIVFENLTIDMNGAGPRPNLDEKGRWGNSSTDSAWEICDAEDLTFRGLKINWKSSSPLWRNSLRAEDCPGLRMKDCDLGKPFEIFP